MTMRRSHGHHSSTSRIFSQSSRAKKYVLKRDAMSEGGEGVGRGIWGRWEPGILPRAPQSRVFCVPWGERVRVCSWRLLLHRFLTVPSPPPPR